MESIASTSADPTCRSIGTSPASIFISLRTAFILAVFLVSITCILEEVISREGCDYLTYLLLLCIALCGLNGPGSNPVVRCVSLVLLALFLSLLVKQLDDWQLLLLL